jgi:DNA-directed RNA polymerase specialized sigma24 family protein
VRAKGGDTAAYERLVRGYQEVAFRTAYLITGDASEAEEATQEAFVKAYRALGRFRSGAHFRPWLLAIVANEARNQRRAAARRVSLREARDGLRDEARWAIGCRYFLGLSEEETAAILGCARGTVKSRLSRALKSLRTEIAKEGDAG